jgi:hypothetical protein
MVFKDGILDSVSRVFSIFNWANEFCGLKNYFTWLWRF